MEHVFLDSITDVKADDLGKLGISGSHGGVYAAAVASYRGLTAVVLNDAGRGLDDAGVAGLVNLNSVGMVGVAVSAQSATIGSATDTLSSGIISFVNQPAAALGIVAGQPLTSELDKLDQASRPTQRLELAQEARWEERVGELRVLCVDSASLIVAEDANRVIVTGSHGALIGGNPARACKAAAKLVVFNDAGGGKNRIGFSRLPALQKNHIAGVTLDCMSCKIGDAASALEFGIVSAANDAAQQLGLTPGQRLKNLLTEPAVSEHLNNSSAH